MFKNFFFFIFANFIIFFLKKNVLITYMTTLRLCPSCEELSVNKAVLNTKKANWIKEFDYVQDFIMKTS